MKIKLYPNESNNQRTTDLMIVVCWIRLANFHDMFTHNFLCVKYRQITKMNVFMLIIHTKCMLASRKEGWPSESEKRH